MAVEAKLGQLLLDVVVDKDGKYAVALNKMQTEANSAAKRMEKSFGALKNFVAGLDIAAAVNTSMKAYEESAMALGKLSAALAAAGEESEQATKRLANYASEIMKVTVYDDDAIITAMAFGKSLGMQTDMLDEAAIAAVGLATRLNIQLNDAMKIIQKASAGNVTQLQRFGVAIDSGASNMEKLNAVLQYGKQGFTMATEYAKSAAGRMQQFRNAVGEAAENLGGALLPLLKALLAIGKPLLEWLAAIPTNVVAGILQIGTIVWVLVKVFNATKAIVAAWKGWAVAIAFVKTAMKDWPAVLAALTAAATVAYIMNRATQNLEEDSRKLGDGTVNLEGRYEVLADSVNKSADAIVTLDDAMKKINKPDYEQPFKEQAERLAQIVEETKNATKAEQERRAAMVGSIQIEDISRKAMEAGLKERFKMNLWDHPGVFVNNLGAPGGVSYNEGTLLRGGNWATRPQIEAAYTKMRRDDFVKEMLMNQMVTYLKDMAYSSTWGRKYEAF